MEQIKLENLTKKYGQKIVLDNISKTFEKGQSTAFMGHNGCGKSTLLKSIAKLITHTSGKVTYSGPLLFHYIPEKFPPVSMTARKYLMRISALGGMKTSEAEKCIELLGEDFFLSELLDIPMRSLSKGTLQKVGVMQALMKTPDVLLLDEPLSGQDVKSQKVFIEKINELRSREVTVFLSCHERKLVDAIAEDVYLISKGRLKAYQPGKKKRYSVILEGSGNMQPTDQMKKYGSYYKLSIEEAVCDKMILELLQQGWKLRSMDDEENS